MTQSKATDFVVFKVYSFEIEVYIDGRLYFKITNIGSQTKASIIAHDQLKMYQQYHKQVEVRVVRWHDKGEVSTIELA